MIEEAFTDEVKAEVKDEVKDEFWPPYDLNFDDLNMPTGRSFQPNQKRSGRYVIYSL